MVPLLSAVPTAVPLPNCVVRHLQSINRYRQFGGPVPVGWPNCPRPVASLCVQGRIQTVRWATDTGGLRGQAGTWGACERGTTWV
ncbi:hypothetical protein NCCP1664_20990 [Zafaria cholistanensis]|uniref:Uncharacterized protein n=1 Tax=Zafaria cholistanensis TaxID=1682741 RepID=A0A5A7NRR9_9MICC|nr:hypothetical protein NCCP1664_20990 [Zafaria cholistanensis]